MSSEDCASKNAKNNNDAFAAAGLHQSTKRSFLLHFPACLLPHFFHHQNSFCAQPFADYKPKVYTHRSGRQAKARKAAYDMRKMEIGDEIKPKYLLKTPKGTRDFGPEQMAVRERVIGIITETFKRHGAVTIDTPVFELREVLMGKYGEEGAKLVYDLADQGGELCSLRYDLTVPFARYLAANKVEKIKRYQIAKVYRRDQPVMTKGRYREFYQCDFDIAGQGEPMVQEAECVKIIDEVLTKLDLGEYEIRVNHRRLLDGMFAASGIPENLFKIVSSSVDKLDKQPWAEVKQELISEKHLDERAVKALHKFVCLRDIQPGWDNDTLLSWFSDKEWTTEGVGAGVAENIRVGVAELKLLMEYAALFGCASGRVVFQPSLARGLDYYTGVIYEVVMKEFSFNPALAAPSSPIATNSNNISPPPAVDANADEPDGGGGGGGTGNLGSVAAGGRYDKLVGMFTEMGKEKEGMKGEEKQRKNGGGGRARPDVPCVGVSFGIERLFAIMEMKMRAGSNDNTVRVSPTDVYVASAGAGKDKERMLRERMKLCARLWEAGIRAETSYKANAKALDQFQFCEQKQNAIQWCLIIGPEELAQNSVKLRYIPTKEETVIRSDDLITVLLEKLGKRE